MMNAPCYKCAERKDNCHATCERYAKYKEDMAERNRQIQLDMDGLSHFTVCGRFARKWAEEKIVSSNKSK